MRLLQVAHAYPPFERSGAETFARALSNALAARGHDVSVFHRVADPRLPELAVEHTRADGLPVVRVNNTFRDCDGFERTYRNPGIDRVFAELVETRRPDLVHIHHFGGLSTGLVRESSLRGIPVVVTLHDYWLICQRGQFLKRDLSLCGGASDDGCAACLMPELSLHPLGVRVRRALRPRLRSGRAWAALRGVYRGLRRSRPGAAERRAVHRRAEHVGELCRDVELFLAPSRSLRERFVAFGVPAERIRQLAYGLDGGGYRARPRDAARRFGYLGTWMPPKGLHVLLEAFAGLDDPRASLHVYGYPVPYAGFEDYPRRLRRLAGPRVSFEGAYDNQDVGRILAGLDVLVVPSIWPENAPLTIQEAQLAGVPVVASRIGGIPELVRDGVDGLLFEPRSAPDLRAKLERLLSEPELLQRLRPRSAAVKGIDASACEHAGIYQELVARRGRRVS